MTRFLTFVVVFIPLMLLYSGTSADFRLPPLWDIEYRDESDGHLKGSCCGSLAVLCNDMDRHLVAQGWQLHDNFTISYTTPRIWMGIWQRSSQERIALLLSERNVAKWSFHFGRLGTTRRDMMRTGKSDK